MMRTLKKSLFDVHGTVRELRVMKNHETNVRKCYETMNAFWSKTLKKY